MDKEQQIRLNFLDEAEDCFDTMESVLLNLSSEVAQPQQLDLALRSAHSVKGGAGMMGFMPLSKIAHELEDFFKILRVRYHSTQIDVEVETLLLQSLDRLRQVSELHREGVEIEDWWLDEKVNPILSALSEHLGEVQDEDEDSLLAETEDVDSTLELVEQGLEIVLDEFEQNLANFTPAELSQQLIVAAEKLVTFGRIADLEPLIELCESIQHQATIVDEATLPALTQQALSLWQRSHALIVRGSLEKLPSRLEGFASPAITSLASSQEMIDLEAEVSDAISHLDDVGVLDGFSEEDLTELDEIAEIENQIRETELELETETDFDFITESWESEEITELHDALSNQDLNTIADAFTVIDPSGVIAESSSEPISQPEINSEVKAQTVPNQLAKQVSKTIRVPVDQLYQFNSLFGKLILERNRVNLRLEQLKNFVSLMRQRMNQLERSNTQLRNWYDRASLEGIIPLTEEPLPSFSPYVSQNGVTNGNGVTNANGSISENYQGEFDALEMDRYSDLHLISQEQIETIVQLQEVSTDIELGLQEMSQAVQELNQTSRSLQGNVTRTQMIPFTEVVKPFPRLIRELSLKFNKQVNLKVAGESTLLDRSMVETLNAPLMHLIRNAFDHGIEDSDTRIANQKSAQGTITLNAVSRGTQTIITISDDGKGINFGKVCDRLREMGITNEQIRQMSEAQILDYIFQPGFTTTDEVTELSGRGVGMDVVRTAIQEIRGDIQVQTQAGQGTTFILKVPYTLSILRVMLVERAGMIFAVPADSVRQVFHLSAEAGSSIQDLEQITWQGETMPLVRLEESLRFNRPHKPLDIVDKPVVNKPTALIVGEDNHLGGIQIDRFWSEQEVSVRPIDSPIRLPQGFISSIVLGDGRVVPVLDPVQVLEESLASNQDQTTSINKEDNATMAIAQSDKILIVDDSINVRRFLALTLEKAGYEVEQAKDGQEAVEKLMAGLAVQAVICDIEMPRLDGYGVLEEVKGKSEFQSLPIAMLTSRSNEKHRKLAMNLGASAYFSKPYNEQQLLDKIAELITH